MIPVRSFSSSLFLSSSLFSSSQFATRHPGYSRSSSHHPVFSTTILFFLASLRTTASEIEIITSAGKSNFLQKVLYKLVIFVDNEIVVKIMLLFADLDCLQFHTSVPELVA